MMLLSAKTFRLLSSISSTRRKVVESLITLSKHSLYLPAYVIIAVRCIYDMKNTQNVVATTLPQNSHNALKIDIRTFANGSCNTIQTTMAVFWSRNAVSHANNQNVALLSESNVRK